MRALAALFLALVTVAPAVAAASLDAAVYGAASAGKPIDERAGSQFLVELDANKTTGYSWSAAVTGNAVSSEGSAYSAPVGGAMGGPGRQIFLFDAARKGTSTITLSYRRPWEHTAAAAKIVTLTVVVR